MVITVGISSLLIVFCGIAIVRYKDIASIHIGPDGIDVEFKEDAQ